jgi:hypothetical protein
MARSSSQIPALQRLVLGFGLVVLLALSAGWLVAAPQAAGLTLEPDNSGSGRPGETVIYVHTLTNEGDGPDTITLTADSSRNWPVTVSPDEISLNPMEETLVLVTLVVPASAQAGQIDVTTVTATSEVDPSVTASATDTTLVPSPVLLPMAFGSGSVEPTECQLVIPPAANPVGIDLVVTAITILPGTPPAGQVATVAVTIKNQGQTSVSLGNNFYLDFYVDPVPEPPGPQQIGDLSWGVQGADLPAGASRTYGADFVFGPGWHHLYAQVDTDNTVVEANENNNVFGCMSLYIAGQERPAGPSPAADHRPDAIRPTPTSPVPAGR